MVRRSGGRAAADVEDEADGICELGEGSRKPEDVLGRLRLGFVLGEAELLLHLPLAPARAPHGRQDVRHTVRDGIPRAAVSAAELGAVVAELIPTRRAGEQLEELCAHSAASTTPKTFAKGDDSIETELVDVAGFVHARAPARSARHRPFRADALDQRRDQSPALSRSVRRRAASRSCRTTRRMHRPNAHRRTSLPNRSHAVAACPLVDGRIFRTNRPGWTVAVDRVASSPSGSTSEIEEVEGKAPLDAINRAAWLGEGEQLALRRQESATRMLQARADKNVRPMD
jgi:hypothetical protein